ncbi:threonine-phosphate decarboxylase CobD [Furfurilactobacillus sp. WILCCON 0119]
MRTGEHGGNVAAVSEQAHVAAASLIDFSANINPLGVPAPLLTVLAEAAPDLTAYPDPRYPTLTAALGRYHHVTPQAVFPNNGALAVLRDVALALKPRQAVVVTPGFSEYERVFQLVGSTVLHYALTEPTGFTLSVSALISWLGENVLPGAVVCLGNPNNPTGQLLTPKTLRPLVDYCQAHQLWLAVDEAFMDFLFDEQLSLLSQLTPADPVVIIRSATKFFAIPGVRLGYGLTQNPFLQQQLTAVTETWAVNAIAQTMGSKLYDQTTYIAETKRWFKTEQPWLGAQLQTLPGVTVFPSRVNFYLFKAPLSDLQERLWQRGIMIRSCDNYPGLDDHFYRVAVKDHECNDHLLTALTATLSETEALA